MRIGGILAASALAVLALLLPPRSLRIEGPWSPALRTAYARGAYHVHTTRSDGTGSVEEVARAASRAGLDFVVLTDHGDATRRPDPPRYIDGVLMIDGVEISTRLGHYAVLGLWQAAPYRLAGWPDEVAEDVRRLGGFGIVAHPDSARHSLSWRDWGVEVDGIEWLNADSEWRDEGRTALLRALLTYPLRPAESIASLFDRPRATLERWDQFARQGRFLVGMAGADAHARLGLRDYEDEDAAEAWAVRAPGYEQAFRAFSTVVGLDAPMAADATADAQALVASIRRGRVHTVIDALAAGGRFEFYAKTAGGTVHPGTTLGAGTSAEFVARALAPPGATIRLLRNGHVVTQSNGLELIHVTGLDLAADERGAAFRVEVVLAEPAGAWSVPWIVSNPIFVERPAADGVAPPAAADPASTVGTGLTGIDLRGCRVEKDAVSTAISTVNPGGDDLELQFRLSEEADGWVALACDLPRPIGRGSSLVADVQSTAPVRLEIQARVAGAGDLRWGRSVFVDSDSRRVSLPMDSLRGVSSRIPAEVPADARVLLFVVDRVHSTPGMRGRVRIRGAALAGPQVRTVSSR